MITIVLLPGMDGTGQLFDPFVEQLPKEWRVVVARYSVSEPLNYEALLSEARKAIPAEGDYFLLGESFSGPIAIKLADSADGRLRGLVLCCSFVRCPSRLLRFAGSWVYRYPVSIVPFPLIETVLLGRFRSPGLSQLLRSAIRKVSDPVYRARLGAVRNIDATDELARLTLPVLYLRASEDHLVGENQSEAMRALCPHLMVSEHSGPHCLLQACSRKAAVAVTSFVAKVVSENASDTTFPPNRGDFRGAR